MSSVVAAFAVENVTNHNIKTATAKKIFLIFLSSLRLAVTAYDYYFHKQY